MLLRSQSTDDRFDISDCSIRQRQCGNLVKTNAKLRKNQGSSLFEMTAVIAIIVPFLSVAATSVTLLLTAANLNDNLCRQAARCASIGPPDAVCKGAPAKSVGQLLASLSRENPFITISPKVFVSETVQQPIPRQPYGGPIDGSVTVITTVNVHLPLLSQLQQKVSWQSRSTVPYTWVMKPCTN